MSDTRFRIDVASRENVAVEADQSTDDSPWALQLAARVEKLDPPTAAAIGAAAALATIELLDDPRSQPEGRVARRRRQAGTVRASARSFGGVGRRRGSVPRCLTASPSNETALRFVPSCRPAMDQAPDALAKLQIQSSPLDEIERVVAVPNGGGLFIAVTPCVEMSWGKQAAQCAHAGQWAWMRSDPETVRGMGSGGTADHRRPSDTRRCGRSSS